MKILLALIGVCVVLVTAEPVREKRQVEYAFPGPSSGGDRPPRGSSARRPAASASGVDRSSPRRRAPQGFPAGFAPVSLPDFQQFPPPRGFGGQGAPDAQSAPAAPPRRTPVHRFRQAPPPPPPRQPEPQPAPRPAPRPVQRRRRPVQRPVQNYDDEELVEEPEEEETVDRLSELLAFSSFGCSGKKDGYYADSSEKVNCQVFHYCQGGKKHSWVCQDGQSFHQVHLICTPNGGNNICSKAADYEFVNDYLYKPVGQEKNVTIYADRFYPENYSLGDPINVPSRSNPQQAQEAYAPQDSGRGRRRQAAAPARRRQPQQQQYAAPQREAQPDYRDDPRYYQGQGF